MLEEPPPNWLFILTTSDASRVLPTILSRCNEVKLNPLPPEVIFSILKMSKGLDFSGARGKVAARASFGSLTRAMLFLEDDTWELRSKILGFLSQPTHEWMKLIDTLSSSQRDMHLGLDVLESVLSDLLAFKVFGNNHRFIHEDQKDFLIQLTEAKHFTVENLSRTLEKLAELRSLTNLTLNAKLLAQEALIPVLNLWLPS
jgi:DNA polymerase-3 subunit delta'